MPRKVVILNPDEQKRYEAMMEAALRWDSLQPHEQEQHWEFGKRFFPGVSTMVLRAKRRSRNRAKFDEGPDSPVTFTLPRLAGKKANAGPERVEPRLAGPETLPREAPYSPEAQHTGSRIASSPSVSGRAISPDVPTSVRLAIEALARRNEGRQPSLSPSATETLPRNTRSVPLDAQASSEAAIAQTGPRDVPQARSFNDRATTQGLNGRSLSPDVQRGAHFAAQEMARQQEERGPSLSTTTQALPRGAHGLTPDATAATEAIGSPLAGSAVPQARILGRHMGTSGLPGRGPQSPDLPLDVRLAIEAAQQQRQRQETGPTLQGTDAAMPRTVGLPRGAMASVPSDITSSAATVFTPEARAMERRASSGGLAGRTISPDMPTDVRLVIEAAAQRAGASRSPQTTPLTATLGRNAQASPLDATAEVVDTIGSVRPKVAPVARQASVRMATGGLTQGTRSPESKAGAPDVRGSLQRLTADASPQVGKLPTTNDTRTPSEGEYLSPHTEERLLEYEELLDAADNWNKLKPWEKQRVKKSFLKNRIDSEEHLMQEAEERKRFKQRQSFLDQKHRDSVAAIRGSAAPKETPIPPHILAQVSDKVLDKWRNSGPETRRIRNMVLTSTPEARARAVMNDPVLASGMAAIDRQEQQLEMERRARPLYGGAMPTVKRERLAGADADPAVQLAMRRGKEPFYTGVKRKLGTDYQDELQDAVTGEGHVSRQERESQAWDRQVAEDKFRIAQQGGARSDPRACSR